VELWLHAISISSGHIHFPAASHLGKIHGTHWIGSRVSCNAGSLLLIFARHRRQFSGNHDHFLITIIILQARIISIKSMSNINKHICNTTYCVKGKANPLQTWTGPEGFRRLRLPDFKTIGTWRWQGCQRYAPNAFTPQVNIPVTHFCYRLRRKDYINRKL